MVSEVELGEVFRLAELRPPGSAGSSPTLVTSWPEGGCRCPGSGTCKR